MIMSDDSLAVVKYQHDATFQTPRRDDLDYQLSFRLITGIMIPSQPRRCRASLAQWREPEALSC